MMLHRIPRNCPLIERVILGANVERIILGSDFNILGILEYTVNKVKKVAKVSFLPYPEATRDLFMICESIDNDLCVAEFTGFSDLKITKAIYSAFAKIILEEESKND